MSLFRSLQSRLLAGLITGTTLLLAANGVVIYVGAKRSLMAELDESLVELLRSNIAEITRQVQDAQWEGWDPRQPFPSPVERADFSFQCWFPSGRTAIKSRHLGDSSLPPLARGFPVISLEGIETGVLYFESIELADGSAGRAVAMRFKPPPPERPRPRRTGGGGGSVLGPESQLGHDLEEGWHPGMGGPPPSYPPPDFELVIAQETAPIEKMLTRLSWLLALAWASSSAGCALILAFLVRRGLRPLDQLRAQLDEVDVEVLDRRVELDDAPTELQPVVEELNGLLARVRRAFERERSFSADVAHELRTPIAGLRTTLEVFLDRERDGAEGRETADRCLAITLEMQGVIEVLLEMVARGGEQGAERWTDVALSPLVAECWSSFAETARERGVALDDRLDPELEVHTDPVLLRRILSNLLENALQYGDPSAPIEVHATRETGTTHLVVSNAVTDIPPETATRAFEAFWRADSSRSETGRHAGLGLPLCRKIAERLGASIEAEHEPGRFTTILTIPHASRAIRG